MAKHAPSPSIRQHLYAYACLSIAAGALALIRGTYPTAVCWIVVAVLLWLDVGGFFSQHLGQFSQKQIAVGELSLGILFLLFAWYRWGDSRITHFLSLLVGVGLFVKGAIGYSRTK